MNTKEIKSFIRVPYASGGYPLFAITDDGAALCKSCTRDNWPAICGSVRSGSKDGWQVIAVDVNWEDSNLSCDHCGDKIESAYPGTATESAAVRRGCDQCEALTINGVYCHETGCPNAWKDYDVECRFCGSLFRPEYSGQAYCDDSCRETFHS